MEKICKNCRWWLKHNHFEEDFGECKHKKLHFFKEGKDVLLTSLNRTLVTGCNFGCIHWEKKEEK